MSQIKCDYCGEYHDSENMDISYKKPISYFMVPENELSERINHVSDDFIVIDEEIFLVHGLVPIPIHEHDEFCWGAWAKVDEQSFTDIWHMFEHDGTGMKFQGELDIEPPGYNDVYGAKIEIQLQTADQRPRFIFKEINNKMAKEQTEGLSLHEINEIREKVFENNT